MYNVGQLCSISGYVQDISSGVFSTLEGYHEHNGGYPEYIGGYSVNQGYTIMSARNIMSIRENVHCTRRIPLTYL